MDDNISTDSNCESEEEYILNDSEIETESDDSECVIPKKRRRINIICDSEESEGQDEVPTTSINVQSINEPGASDIWTEVEKDPPDFEFRGQPQGLNLPPKLRTPGELIDIFLSDEFVDMMVQETNQYAADVIGKKRILRNSSRFLNWRDTNRGEMLTFWALILHMGCINLPTIEHYWNKSHLYNLPFWRIHMSRNRFQILLRFLHFSHSTNQENSKLHKIAPVIKHFNNVMNCVYNPGKDLVIDESLVLWRGRLCFRQYIKNKFGVKLYELCESQGTLLRVQIYCGKSELPSNDRNHSTSVVFSLMDGFLDIGHVLYMDNFYNSVSLAKQLTLRSTYVCGTLRLNRKGNPKELVQKKLKKGEHSWKRSESVVICKWRDKRDVLTISNMHKVEMVEVANRNRKVSTKPNIVRDYTKGMAGVDRSDQMLSYYTAMRKTLRWYKKIAVHIMEMAVHNAYIFYLQQSNAQNKTSLQFREDVIKYLLNKNQNAVFTQSQPSTSTVPKNFIHYLDTIPPTPKKRNPTRQCRVCTTKKIRKETRYHCPTCPDKPPLCIGLCYKLYHENNSTGDSIPLSNESS